MLNPPFPSASLFSGIGASFPDIIILSFDVGLFFDDSVLFSTTIALSSNAGVLFFNADIPSLDVDVLSPGASTLSPYIPPSVYAMLSR